MLGGGEGELLPGQFWSQDLQYSPLVGKGFLPYREAPAAGCQACQFCHTVVWLLISFQRVCGGLGLQLNQSPTSLSGPHKPGLQSQGYRRLRLQKTKAERFAGFRNRTTNLY